MDIKEYLTNRTQRADNLKAERQGLSKQLQEIDTAIRQLSAQKDNLMMDLATLNGRIVEVEAEVSMLNSKQK